MKALSWQILKILVNENCLLRFVMAADVLLEVSDSPFTLYYVTLPNTPAPLSFGDILGLQACMHFHERFSMNLLQ